MPTIQYLKEKFSQSIFHNPEISTILKNFRGQCLRVHAFFHVCALPLWFGVGGAEKPTNQILAPQWV